MALRCVHVISAALLTVAIVGIVLVVLTAKSVEMPAEDMYGIVLDAGSSHTSMYIYKWPANKLNDTGIVSQHSECHVEGGGISSYAGIHGGAATSLTDCLNEAVRVIPKSRHHQTPLHLGATAGMRLLKMANATESDRILKEVENKLRSYPFMFKEASILSGQREGVYGWVTVNYLLDNFVKYGLVRRWLDPGRPTIGALDLGGASTQITFETPETVEADVNFMELKLFGKIYKLYTQSFLCYGQDQFEKKLLTRLIKTQGVASSTISHPCYPQQFTTSIQLGSLDSPCTKENRPAQFDHSKNITVVGTGDYQSCLDNVKMMFSFDKCNYTKCSFNGVFQPSMRGSFMAFSAFYFTHMYMDTLTSISVTSPSQMEEAIRLVCNMTISQLTEKTKQPEKYMKNVCAVANFVQVLLTEGYRFDELTFPSISFEQKAGGASVGWSLGYMLSLSNMVPAESPGLMKALHSGAWGGILFLFIALLLIGLGYLLMLYRNAGTKEDMV